MGLDKGRYVLGHGEPQEWRPTGEDNINQQQHFLLWGIDVDVALIVRRPPVLQLQGLIADGDGVGVGESNRRRGDRAAAYERAEGDWPLTDNWEAVSSWAM